jgi:hypothetical protein
VSTDNGIGEVERITVQQIRPYDINPVAFFASYQIGERECVSYASGVDIKSVKRRAVRDLLDEVMEGVL